MRAKLTPFELLIGFGLPLSLAAATVALSAYLAFGGATHPIPKTRGTVVILEDQDSPPTPTTAMVPGEANDG